MAVEPDEEMRSAARHVFGTIMELNAAMARAAALGLHVDMEATPMVSPSGARFQKYECTLIKEIVIRNA